MLGVATATSINGVALDNNAWTATAPAVDPSTGSFTAPGATGRYKQIGKTVIYQFTFAISNIGMASGVTRIDLPFTAAAFPFMGIAKDSQSNNMLMVVVDASATRAILFGQGLAFTLTTGSVVSGTISYERT